MFSTTCEVLLKIMDRGDSSQRVEVEFAYEVLISFEFVFILHFVNETMGSQINFFQLCKANLKTL